METKKKKNRGMVFIEPHRCKGCGFCVEFCPAKVLELSNEFNVLGYHYPVAVKPESCTGCDQCGAFCPDYAIFGKRV